MQLYYFIYFSNIPRIHNTKNVFTFCIYFSVNPPQHNMSHIREERFDSMISDHENYADIDDFNTHHRRNRRATSEMYWPSRRKAMYDYETGKLIYVF